eukprot:GHVU01222581.1.p1 GENE.GHVU01222581.1~~GHVU01222581.1.p1  ORF type:complete len:156 (-),score=10.69 GHVU01222581.1:87-554(-)
MYFAATELLVTQNQRAGLEHLSEMSYLPVSELPLTSTKQKWYDFVIKRLRLENAKENGKAWKIEAADDLELDNGLRVVLMRASGSDHKWLRLSKDDNTSLIDTVPTKLEFLVLFKDGEWSLRGESVCISRSDAARDGQFMSLCHPPARLCAPRLQ